MPSHRIAFDCDSQLATSGIRQMCMPLRIGGWVVGALLKSNQ
jgi:hypothetical protein